MHTAGGGTETFTYTIRDADGSLAHATLTISLGDAAPSNFNIPAAGGAATTVFEAGLPARGGEPAGSHSGDPTFPTTTQTGTITFMLPPGWTTAPTVVDVELVDDAVYRRRAIRRGAPRSCADFICSIAAPQDRLSTWPDPPRTCERRTLVLTVDLCAIATSAS